VFGVDVGGQTRLRAGDMDIGSWAYGAFKHSWCLIERGCDLADFSGGMVVGQMSLD